MPFEDTGSAAAPAGKERADELLAEWLGQSLPGRVDGAEALDSPVVLHIAAVAPVAGVRHVIRIGEHAPRSAVDFYLLNAARAWADVVVSSGKILRAEPELSFALSGPDPEAARALARARARRTGSALRIGVLSSGSGLDETMPVWTRGGEFTLVTDSVGGRRSRGWAERAGLGVVALDPVGPRAAVEWAVGAASTGGSAGRVSVELGAKSSVHLYPEGDDASDDAPGPRGVVDVLVLSEYLGPLSERALGDRFLAGVDLERLYTPGPEARDGEWRFRCWTRRGGAP